jgi:predicted dithiol-disulfide oxidoreductase (DUF899 family)
MSTTEWMQLKSITLHDEGEAPQLWPDGASDEYVAARQELLDAEIALCDQLHAVARMRRDLPRGVDLPPYTLAEGPRDLDADGPPRPVTLRDLFGDHESLVVYHLMFHPDDEAACAMCSMWVDGLHGVSHHITRRAGLAVIGKAPVAKLRAWGRRRGWHGLRLVSAYGTDFATDVGTEGSQGGQVPAMSVFVRDGDVVRHAYTQSAEFPDDHGRGIDAMCAVWSVLDLLPSGRGDWLPDNTYPGASRGSA